ncbi:hypothetical protein ACHAQH_008721, partial [Verticillium albo-atrum]
MPSLVAQFEPIEIIDHGLDQLKEPSTFPSTHHTSSTTSTVAITPLTQKSVAVIGAGVSGVLAAAHLLKRNQKVTVFERALASGGIWRYEEEKPDDPEFPAPNVTDGLLEPRPILRKTFDNASGTAINGAQENQGFLTRKLFAPPGPCYAGLRSNIPTYLMRSSLSAWPESAGRDIVAHHVVKSYVQGLARDFGVDAVTEFNTRVEEVIKPEGARQWRVRTLRLENVDTASEDGQTFIEGEQFFDAVVVASGHYDKPYIPSIPGLHALKKQFPERVTHSKQYRRPEVFANQNVVV